MSTEPTNPFLAIVAKLGPTFAARAADTDRSGEFVAENYRELKAAKVFSAGVPKDLGGGGATHAELCDLVRALAHHCPSTALALSMHTHLVASAVWRHVHGQPAAPLLQKVAAGELVLVSTGATDWLESVGTSTRVEGGYRVSAHKRFASGCPAGDLALTSIPYDDPSEGKLVLQFAVPVRTEGVRIANDWDTLGMRATGSHTLVFENVFVPDAAVSMKRPSGQWVPFFGVICMVAVPIYVSAYVGLAEAAANLARESARKRPADAHLPYLVGEMENALAVVQMAWREMVAGARNYDFLPDVEGASATLIRKTIVAEHLDRCMRKAIDVTGGGAFFRKNPLEKLSRDAQGIHFHPLPEIRQLHFTGRVAMGLPPV